MHIDERLQQIATPSSQNNMSLINTTETSNPFFVPRVSDNEFNQRMKENELNQNNLFDIHVQEFIDKGYNKHDATQRTSQYAFIGALNIPGQLNISSLLFNKNANSEVKDIFKESMKSSLDNMSNNNIAIITSEILHTMSSPGLTPIYSRVLIPNPEPRPTADISRAQAEIFGMNLTPEIMEEMGMKEDEGYEPFLLGPIIYYDKEKKDKDAKYPVDRPSFISIDTIEDYFQSIISKLTAIENDEEIPDDEKKNTIYAIDLYKSLVAGLQITVKNKLEEKQNDELILNQYTQNNRPNLLE